MDLYGAEAEMQPTTTATEALRQVDGHQHQPVALRVTNETGPLEQVIVHTPGPEMELVSPQNREHLLFEDILYVSHARQEHLLMTEVFKKVVGQPEAVLQLGALLREAFDAEEARHHFVERLCAVSRVRNLQAFERELKRLAAEELYEFALTGQSPLPLHVPPLPNLMFTRDLAAVVGDHIIASQAARAARVRESLLVHVVLRHHPALARCGGCLIDLPPHVTFEGGALLVARPELVLIGHSERTSMSGVMAATQALFARTGVQHVLAVDLPKRRSCMHLDTVFTFASPNECVVFPPLIAEGDLHNVIHFTRGDAPDGLASRPLPNLQRALEELLDRPLTFIPCGGDDPLSQHREQWTDGANFFAVAPGVVVGYERNEQTFEAMRRHGYRVVSAEGFLAYYAESDFRPDDEKVAIKLEGNELSRGRGGPRCMTLPLARGVMT